MEAIAVLGLKRRGLLRRDDFECAMIDGNWQDKINEAYANMSGTDPVATTLENNAIPVSQRDAAYAIRQETRFVGLFDWYSTFLFYFGELDITQSTQECRVLSEQAGYVFRRGLWSLRE